MCDGFRCVMGKGECVVQPIPPVINKPLPSHIITGSTNEPLKLAAGGAA